MYAPSLGAYVIEAGSVFKTLNSQPKLSIEILDFLADTYKRAVVNPVGKLNPEIQKTAGFPLNAQECNYSHLYIKS